MSHLRRAMLVLVTLLGLLVTGSLFAQTITSISPPSGTRATQVTITGSGFGTTQGSNFVMFATTKASVQSWSSTQILCTPQNTGAATVSVYVSVGGVQSNQVSFTLTNPVINNLSINSAPVDQEITINGNNLGSPQGSSSVTFNNVTANPTSWSNTSIVVPVPSGATTGNIVVTVNGVASTGYMFMVVPPTPPPGVQFIQGNWKNGASGSTSTIAFPITQNARDLNVVVVSWLGTNSISSVTDSAGNSYALAVGPTVGSSETQATYYAKDIFEVGKNVVSVVFASAPSGANLRIAEYSGLDLNSPLNVTAAAIGTGSAQNETASSGDVTTTNTNDLLVGASAVTGMGTQGPGANYTNRVITTGNGGNILEDRIVTAAGSYAGTASLGCDDPWVMQMVAFKEAQNQAPYVDAGPNQTITWPVNTVALDGVATDDGLPNNTLTVTWSQVSGPSGVTFGNSSVPVTTATFPGAGVYVLQLTANDSQLSTSATTTVTVNAAAVAATLSAAQTETVTVSAYTGPWSLAGGLNSAYTYGNSGTSPPVVFPVVAGEVISLQYLSGDVSIGVAAPFVDAAGWNDPGQNGVRYSQPAFYATKYQNASSLIGAWTDAKGQLIAPPFAVNDGITVTAPTGAVQLQLGVNDTYYNDNLGSWSISIQGGVPLLSAGPDVTGTSQRVNAYISSDGLPVANASVQFTVTGANPTTSNATTNSVGIATFSYVGANQGTDTVQATYGTVLSNAVTVSWITPVNSISASTSIGNFFLSDGSCTFDTTSSAIPAFTQEFPSILFNPPTNFVPGNSTINVNTVPLTDVTTDLNGNFTGTIVAQGNGYQAGVGAMSTAFQAEFAGSFVVKQAGDLLLDMSNDGGFILGVGGGAKRLSGPMVGAPTATPFQSLPVMSAYNAAVSSGPQSNVINLNFPTSGTFPFELDYIVCNGNPQTPMSLTMGVGSNGGTPTTSAGSLSITPTNPPPVAVQQIQQLTVLAKDGTGSPIANLAVLGKVYGANRQYLTGTTNSSGQATLQYTGVYPGTDTIQVVSHVNSSVGVSNVINVTWTGVAGNTYIFTPQGWISSPLIGAVVQNQVPITLAPGVTLTSGTLKYFPSSNSTQVTVLNANTVGTGPLTLGTFDATSLTNGQYTIQLESTASTGVSQLNEIVVSVTGNYKPGRQVVSATDLKIPLAGIPINITRVYDSLNRGSVQDFGNGWRLDTNVSLSVDLLMNVTLTLDGNAQTFYFTPQSSGNALFPWMLAPHYTPQPGLHGTLTSNGCSTLIQVDGAIVQDAGGVVCFPEGTYQPTVYTYTDPIGRAYTIASTGQLQQIQDLNGNVLTFAANGITSSVGGVVVPFVRDSQNRITKITDLNGNNYVYTYDSPCNTGNLCSVTFPGLTAPAQYTYLTDHSLATQVDPIGNTTITVYYSSANDGGNPLLDGRIYSITGPSVPGPNGTTQYVTQYAYNIPANSTTVTNPDGGKVTTLYDSFGKPLTVTDALNRTTTYKYDSHENLVQMIDALQNPAWVYTFDANGCKTSIQDPLGNTSHTTYNQFCQAIQSIDAANTNTQTLTYDSNFNLKQVTDLENGPNTSVMSATYDTMGDVLTSTDANGQTTQYEYDPRGNLIQTTDPLNEVTHLGYDPMDRLVSQTDPRGNTTQFTYDALGNLKTKTDPLGNATTYTYDNNGNRLTQKDANNNNTFFHYDALNRLTKITYPDNTTKQFTYDFRNNKLTEIDQAGHESFYVYDLAGELQSVTYAYGTADAGTVQHTYDLDAKVKTVKDELGNTTTNNYDRAERLTSVQDATTNLPTVYGYDADNRVTSVKDPNGNTVSYAYFPRNWLETVTYPATSTQPITTNQYTYDGMGRLLTTTDQASQVTTDQYDQVGRLRSVTDAQNQKTQYFYDVAGNLQFIEDALGRFTAYQYDPDNRLTLRTLPLGMSEYRTYDPVGNLSTKQDFNGKTTSYRYDTLNRLTQRIPDASLHQTTVSFTYTPTGERLSMTDASGTTSYTSYDNRDRLKTKTTPEGTLNYTYDAHSNLLTIASSNTNGASMQYTYDVLNRLGTAKDLRMAALGGPSTAASYSYDPASNLTSFGYPNTLQVGQTFDPLKRLTQTCVATSAPACSASQKLASYAYTLGYAGNRTGVTELNGRNVTYAYDNDYRLKSETISGDPAGNNGAESYSYDLVGNRLTLNSTIPSLSGANSYSYDANDRLSTDTYDKDGNTTVSGGITNTYDFENYLLKHSTTVTMVYDGDGNRASETVGSTPTKYLMDDKNPTGLPQVLDEIVNGAVTRTYAYGRQRISENQLVSGSWVPSFYGYDGHGNARFLANSAGTVTDTYTFDAFGAQIASTGTTSNPYLYSGERFDSALNLYHLRARYYNMLTGRFETMDPGRETCCALGASQVGNIFDPASLHKYVYTQNNPVNRIDPSGKDAILEYMVELGEEEKTIEEMRLVDVAVRDELVTACIEVVMSGLESAGVPTLEAYNIAKAQCNALYF